MGEITIVLKHEQVVEMVRSYLLQNTPLPPGEIVVRELTTDKGEDKPQQIGDLTIKAVVISRT